MKQNMTTQDKQLLQEKLQLVGAEQTVEDFNRVIHFNNIMVPISQPFVGTTLSLTLDIDEDSQISQFYKQSDAIAEQFQKNPVPFILGNLMCSPAAVILNSIKLYREQGGTLCVESKYENNLGLQETRLGLIQHWRENENPTSSAIVLDGFDIADLEDQLYEYQCDYADYLTEHFKEYKDTKKIYLVKFMRKGSK